MLQLGKLFLIMELTYDTKTYRNIKKFTTGQRDDYTTASLLDFSYY